MLTKRSLTTAGNLAVLIERTIYLWGLLKGRYMASRITLASHTHFQSSAFSAIWNKNYSFIN